MIIDKEIIGIIIQITVYVVVMISILLYFKWEMNNFKNDRLALKPCYKYKDVDKEIYRLVRMLNCIPYLHTTCSCSCSGHGENPIRIWFNIPAKKVNFVMHYFFNNLNYKDWFICVETTDSDLKNKEKARIKLARLHEKISNQRLDFLHKLSSKFVSENQTICIEDLNLQGMSKLWGRKINDLSYYNFTQMLLYKSVWNGKNLIKIDRFDPSSQICSNCGYQNHNLKLIDRTWKCPNCGSDLDRDINTAINIRDFGLNEFNLRQELSEVKPLERKALTKRNRKKSSSETVPDELGKKKSHSEMEARVALATL